MQNLYQIRKMNLTYYKGIILKNFGEKRLYSFEKKFKRFIRIQCPENL